MRIIDKNFLAPILQIIFKKKEKFSLDSILLKFEMLSSCQTLLKSFDISRKTERISEARLIFGNKVIWD